LEVRITGHKFGRRPSKDHSTKVLLQLAQWKLCPAFQNSNQDGHHNRT
jgi:hypothetical protein